jgi:hypothetical protein|tara:strand:+ start:877 stop:1209 length:333 start_codon:yes stop_codon:yes gene_type:complete
MEIRGKLIKKLDVETGTSKAGNDWKKQSIVLETDAEFNNEVCISVFGEEKMKQMNKLDIGMSVSVLCNVYSREFKGKYYTSLDGYHFTDKTNAGESSADDFVTSDNDMPF